MNFGGHLAQIALPNWKIVGVILAALAVTHISAFWVGVARERASAAEVRAEAAAASAALTERSQAQASEERELDGKEIDNAQRDRDQSIKDSAADNHRPSAASNALNCERLRAEGRDINRIPACAGRAGGSQASGAAGGS